MKQIYFLILAYSLSAIVVYSQTDTVFNQVDVKGLKQGYWKKNFPDGKLMYKGFFKDDKPVGEMRRYYDTGELKALLRYASGSQHIQAKLYYNNGELAAEGCYFGEKKDSTWKYYSFYTGTITAQESFIKGIKDGKEIHYYENGKVSEEVLWKNDIRQGAWSQYFDNGAIKLNATYVSGKLDGLYAVYYPNGKYLIMGEYAMDKQNGKWTYYLDDGQVKTEIVYIMGKAENEEEIMEKEKEYFQMIEENLGKHKEPTPEELVQ